MIHSFYKFFLLAFLVSGLANAQAPANDNPCGAIGLTVTTTCSPTAVNNSGATNTTAPAPGCASYSGQDVWFSFVAPSCGSVTITSGAGTATDWGMAVYNGPCASVTGPLGCDDDSGPGLMPELSLTGLTSGVTYYIRLWVYGGGTGTATVCVFSACGSGGGGGGGTCGVSCSTCGGSMVSLAAADLTSGPNGCDDCSSGLINLGFTYNVCSNPFTSCYINSNGNLTFGSSYTTYTPVGMPNASTAVMVAPFWADWDNRSCGRVCHEFQAGTLIVSWIDAGYYNQWCDKIQSCQVIITDGTRPIIGVGNNTAFLFGNMSWTTGDASSGTSGFGGSPAIPGINANDGVNASWIGHFDAPGMAYDGPSGANDGVDYLDYKSYYFTAGDCTVLPYERMDISSSALADAVRITWSTNAEATATGFYLERSHNGQDFSEISFVAGSGSVSQTMVSFEYLDHTVNSDQNYYYRLRYQDVSGNWSYSPVVVSRIMTQSDFVLGDLYPNPVSPDGSLQIDGYQDKQVSGILRITDMTGKTVKTFEVNLCQGYSHQEFLLDGLPSGTYSGSFELEGYKPVLRKFTVK